MGIYHRQVTDGAHYSGNTSVLMLDPKFRNDLQALYSDYMEPQDSFTTELMGPGQERPRRIS